MKFSKILTTAFVALGATLALSGCIRETYPKESTITAEQLAASPTAGENLLKGIARGILAPAYGGWEHSDFGFPSVGVYNDHAAQIICTNGWMLGNAPAYNRFYMGAWGKSYGATGWMPVHFWYTYYPQIKSCNDVVKLVADYNLDSSYAAIARTFRASLYLDLARLFECMYIEKDFNDYATQSVAVQGLTVPIVTEFTTEEGATKNPRATREELFTYILEDLAFAEEELAKETYRPNSVSDPTLAVVYGMYARVYLWLGGFTDGLNGELPEGNAAYTLASEYAQKAIQEFGGAVMTEDEWTNKTSGFNTKASSWMWTLRHSTDTIAGNLHQFSAHMAPEASYGYCQFTCPGVGSNYYDMMSNTDFRKKLIIAPEWSNWLEFKQYTTMSKEEYEAMAPYTFFKFRPGQGNRTDYATGGAIDIPMMRCEEMYFIDMEATYHTKGADAALSSLINFMTTYRDPNFRFNSQDYLDLIIKHKAIEFWGEGIVMYDMKRLNMGVDCAYEGTNYDEQRRFSTDHRLPWWTPVIPQSETQINTAITANLNNPDPTSVVEPKVVAQE